MIDLLPYSGVHSWCLPLVMVQLPDLNEHNTFMNTIHLWTQYI